MDTKNNNYEPVNIRKYLSLAESKRTNSFAKHEGFQSSFFNPYTRGYTSYSNLMVVNRLTNGDIPCSTLRRVSKKAFIINICINHVLKKIKPFLKPSSDMNTRGFCIKERGSVTKEQLSKKSKKKTEIETFLRNCGNDFNSERDNFQRFCLKVVRDSLELDQVATEIGYTKGGKPYAFQAIDAGTINKVVPGQNNPDNIKYIQVIDGMQQAFYTDDNLVFDYQNPRSDVEHAYYGYSVVDQVIDLVTSLINTFTYNAGFFTENKLPRGMLLIDGNVSADTVSDMEDYIADIMSGTSSSQWRIPIIPSGSNGDNSQSIKWVSLAGSSKDMEFQQFLDFQVAGIVAMFGCSMDELGLQSSKSQAIFDNSKSSVMQASKSLILGDMLSFLQDYVNKILIRFYPEYELEFIGYEQDDPKQVLDMDKEELESYKTLNEKRLEKGLPKLEAKWADLCPANPQFTQMYQSEQANQQAEGGEEEQGDFNADDFTDDELAEDSNDTENSENKDFGDIQEEETSTEENQQTENAENKDFGDLGKSLLKKDVAFNF